MSALARKVCMLGDFGVGKTSLVARFVRNTFSEQYLTTVGAKVDSKEVALPSGDVLKLVVWDIAGKSALDALNMNYLRGASGLLLVADGTREATLRVALDLLMQSRDLLPGAEVVLLVNKLDIIDRWEVAPTTLAELRRSLPVFETSARFGDGVEAAFAELARRLA
ncbi:MAG TPA: Rab family GTPase [Dokdonella sp.]|uniref:Rab family GTPase n=1 Tax=Dokdonella sp. TaxID=2291710 RepID=UPI0025B92157|nr:Rab family GTPase [Dokdonella sp.]MBX3690887.1 GTP-binding protein [Dokdonella sp.]MCW5568550.1 GTP-binding protein [Dokdonella sp.]HNR91403.1 Rab family GTPase [Dokdonella sp.]